MNDGSNDGNNWERREQVGTTRARERVGSLRAKPSDQEATGRPAREPRDRSETRQGSRSRVERESVLGV